MNKYYKKYSEDKYSFQDAYDIVNKNMRFKMSIKKEIGPYQGYKSFELTHDDIEEKKTDVSVPYWAYGLNDWEIYEPDDEKNAKAEEIGDWIEDDLNFELDTRFYDSTKMGISDWWEQLNQQLIDEDVMFDIMCWLKETNRLNKKSKNLCYSRLNQGI